MKKRKKMRPHTARASHHHNHQQTNFHCREKQHKKFLTQQKPFILIGGNTRYNIRSELKIAKIPLNRKNKNGSK